MVMQATMFHVSAIVLNPQPHTFLFPLPVSTSRNFKLSQTLHFPRNSILRSLSPSLHPTPQYDDSEEHVIGDCIVFEEGVFDDPLFHSSDTLTVDKPKPKPGWRKKVEENVGENLVPGKWREVQAEINITKRDRRKIAREMEFNSKVEKKRRGLIPLRDMNLDEYKAYKEAKLAQMKFLDNASSSPVKEDVPQPEPELNRGEEGHPEPELNGGERVEPKNPRWLVYGRGFEDVTEFFNSENYDPDAKTLQGKRKLFTKEEKLLLNKRVPDLETATSVSFMLEGKKMTVFFTVVIIFLLMLKKKSSFSSLMEVVVIFCSANDVAEYSIPLMMLSVLLDWILCGHRNLVAMFFDCGKGQRRKNGSDSLIASGEYSQRYFQDKWQPLHTLAACGEFELLDSLLKHNVDINAVDKDGLTALQRAVIGKKQAITNYLLRNSANPFVLDKEGATLMHYAVLTASTQSIKLLLLYNVDINLQDNYGWTPLHLAVQAQRTDLVRLLLIKGADKTSKNKDGLTPLDLCLYSGQSARTYELIKLFKQPLRRVSHVSKR